MKYIRTKDGIYEIVEDNNKEWGKQIVVKFPKNLNMKLADVKDQILQQADTIEELCDEFVYANKSNENKNIYAGFVAIQSKISTMCEIAKTIKSDLYGAIWTSKGLIYIAKMNDKGELDLIWK